MFMSAVIIVCDCVFLCPVAGNVKHGHNRLYVFLVLATQLFVLLTPAEKSGIHAGFGKGVSNAKSCVANTWTKKITLAVARG